MKKSFLTGAVSFETGQSFFSYLPKNTPGFQVPGIHCNRIRSVKCFVGYLGLLLTNNRRARLSSETIEKLITVKEYLLDMNIIEENDEEPEYDDSFDIFYRLCDL